MRTILLALLVVLGSVARIDAIVVDGQVLRPITTYSIVARDPETGQIGVAVQSHWFSVGSSVPWVEAGVGAVATQSLVDITYGPLGLEMMRAGRTANQALAGLLKADDSPWWRQVGMIDALGNHAVHTGRKCIRQAGHATGKNFVCMANLMENDTVWSAMANAYLEAKGDLAERMLVALEAAQAEGGDIRGRQSAAIIVVTGEPTGLPWKDRIIDLRVEDNPDPLKELRRLVGVSRAYKFMNEGDERLATDDTDGAMRAYNRAMELAPQITEIRFWSAVTLFTSGEEKKALEIFREVFEKEGRWIEVVRRLPKADLLPNDNGELERILSAAHP